MSNAMKYIKSLEAAGFARDQAEAQVQMVLDALEGDLVTKADFSLFQEKLENRFSRIDHRFEQIDQRFEQIDKRFEQIDHRFEQIDKRFEQVNNQFIQTEARIKHEMQGQIKESEFRITTRLGFLMVSTTSIAVAVLTWLIKL